MKNPRLESDSGFFLSYSCLLNAMIDTCPLCGHLDLFGARVRGQRSLEATFKSVAVLQLLHNLILGFKL